MKHLLILRVFFLVCLGGLSATVIGTIKKYSNNSQNDAQVVVLLDSFIKFIKEKPDILSTDFSEEDKKIVSNKLRDLVRSIESLSPFYFRDVRELAVYHQVVNRLFAALDFLNELQKDVLVDLLDEVAADEGENLSENLDARSNELLRFMQEKKS